MLVRVVAAAAFLLLVGADPTRAASIVYDDLSFSTFSGHGGSFTYPIGEKGQEIFLTGTSQEITSFEVALDNPGSSSSSGDLVLRFYLPDGTGGSPGTLLWQSTPTAYSVSGWSTLTFAVPSVVVPQNIIWTMDVVSGGEGADLVIPETYAAPSIGNFGTKYDYRIDINSWSPCTCQGLGVKILAESVVVPEPTTALFLATGLAGLAVRRRSTSACHDV